MRLHLRLAALCTVAVLAAGCANHDNSTSSVSGTSNRLTTPTVDCTTTIGDRIWYDVNCNGIQDKDETGGPDGIKVTLINCQSGDKIGTVTDGGGYYSFTDVPAGSYQICIEIPGGFAATLEDVGSNDGIDSDINSDGCTGCRTYECDKPDLSRDAGLCEKKGTGDEGCTPGFWRNHLSQWAATGISPNDKVNATFGCKLVADDNLTLGVVIDAPQTYGTLAFHAIAALLNASHPDVDFGLSASEVIDLACAGDKDTLADENEKGCPLSGGNTTGKGPKK
jgi:SdrD B-like domain